MILHLFALSSLYLFGGPCISLSSSLPTSFRRLTARTSCNHRQGYLFLSYFSMNPILASQIEEQRRKKAGNSSGALRARCSGTCVHRLPDAELPRRGHSVTGIALGKYCFRRNDAIALYSLVSATVFDLNEKLDKHFSHLKNGMEPNS